MTSFQEKEAKITWRTHLCNQLFMWPQARGWMFTASGYISCKQCMTHTVCKYTCMQRDSGIFEPVSKFSCQQSLVSLVDIECRENKWENWYRERTTKPKTRFQLPEKGEVPDLSAQQERAGRKRERESEIARERSDWEGVFLCGWERQRRRRGGDRQRERENSSQSLRSSLWWGHAEVNSWGIQWREGGKREQKRRSRVILLNFPVTTSDCLWPPLDSHAPITQTHRHTHRLTHCLAHHLQNWLCCSVRSKGFPQVRHREFKPTEEIKGTREKEKTLSLCEYTSFFWEIVWMCPSLFECQCWEVSRKSAVLSLALLQLVFQHACLWSLRSYYH